MLSAAGRWLCYCKITLEHHLIISTGLRVFAILLSVLIPSGDVTLPGEALGDDFHPGLPVLLYYMGSCIKQSWIRLAEVFALPIQGLILGWFTGANECAKENCGRSLITVPNLLSHWDVSFALDSQPPKPIMMDAARTPGQVTQLCTYILS